MAERSAWIPGGVLALGCVLTLAIDRQVKTPLALPLDSIPLTLAGRMGQAGTIPPDQERAAGVSSYIFRWYNADSAPFDIYVGYYDQQTQGKTIHSPKNCLPGSGWEALNQSTTTLQTASGPETVNRYLLQNKQQRALVFYWYQGRGRVASNEYRVKWELLRDSALRGRSEEALVRIVVHLNTNTTEAQASEEASKVAADLIPAMFRVLPRW
jgi:EpsI family protein